MYEIRHIKRRKNFALFRNRAIHLFSRRNQCFIPRGSCKNGYFSQSSDYQLCRSQTGKRRNTILCLTEKGKKFSLEKNTNWKSKFMTVALGKAVSMIGSHGVQFALIWWLAEITFSPLMLGISGGCRLSPNDFIQPISRNCRRSL